MMGARFLPCPPSPISGALASEVRYLLPHAGQLSRGLIHTHRHMRHLHHGRRALLSGQPGSSQQLQGAHLLTIPGHQCLSM